MAAARTAGGRSASTTMPRAVSEASGAADRTSFRLANRLVGNPEDAAAVEVTFGGFAARARRDLVVAVTGAPCPVTVGDRQGAVNSVLFVRAGECLRLGRPERGLRSYVAVRGGLAVERVLGSASTDVNSLTHTSTFLIVASDRWNPV